MYSNQNNIKLILILIAMSFVSCETNTIKDEWQIAENEMSNPRYSFGTELHNDKIYVLGGIYNTAFVGIEDRVNFNSIEVFNIDSQTWSEITLIPKTQLSLTTELVENKIYMFGGYPCIPRLQIYNIEENSFSDGPDLPYNIRNSTSEFYDGKIYLIGGDCVEDSIYANTKMLSYNIHTQNYKVEPEMPSELFDDTEKFYSLNSIKYKDNFYVWSNSKMIKYNVISKEWANVGSAKPYVKLNQKGIVYNENIVFFGGTNIIEKGRLAENSVTICNPNFDTWEIKENQLNFRRHFDYGAILHNGTIYLIGGRDSQSWDPLGTVEYNNDFSI